MRRLWVDQRLRAALAHAALIGFPAMGFAGVSFGSGSATWSWDADTLTANGGKTTFTISPPSTGSMPVAPSYQLNKTGTFNAGSASGKGSIGYVTTSTTATFTLAGGSGSSQVDPNNDFPGETVTKVTFSGTFDVTSPGFGPTAVGYYSLQVAGTAGVGGYAKVIGDLSFKLNNASGANLRTPISFNDQFNGGSSPTPFSKTYTFSTPFSPVSLSTSDKIFVSGSLTFIASNLGSPSDIVPFNLEAGGAPPTATYYVPGGSGGNWHDQASWAPPNNPAAGVFAFNEPGALLPPIPDGVGHRARFVNIGPEPRTVQLTAPITLGSLDINDDGTITIGGTSAITMDVNTGNASTFIGANFGNARHSVDVPIVLADDLDIRVESASRFRGGSQIDYNNPITNVGGAGAPRNVRIAGGGAVNYNAANAYFGTTSVADHGTLRANASGALGTGTVNVLGANLELNAQNPAGPGGGSIDVGAGGLLRLGIPAINGVNVKVSPNGGITGSTPVLTQVVLNVGGGSIDMPSGFIGHEVYDPTGASSPQNLGLTAAYIYGFAADVPADGGPSINIGTGFATPWGGIGGDRGVRTFGLSPTDPTTPLVNVAGKAQIVSFGGEFNINARLTGGSAATLEIAGGGITSLDSQFNTYAGRASVEQGGTLRVNGRLPASSVLVKSGGTIGGGGTISGAVEVSDGATLDPGIGIYDNVTANLTVGSLVLRPGSILDFEFGGEGPTPNDSLTVNGDLTLDGFLVINQLQDFDVQDVYMAITFTGNLIDNGLEISPRSQPINGVPANQVVSIVITPTPTGGQIGIVIPEPGVFAGTAVWGVVVARRRRCRK